MEITVSTVEEYERARTIQRNGDTIHLEGEAKSAFVLMLGDAKERQHGGGPRSDDQ